jgi:hypothetical protein
MANLEMLRAEELKTATLESLSGGAPFPFPIPAFRAAARSPPPTPTLSLSIRTTVSQASTSPPFFRTLASYSACKALHARRRGLCGIPYRLARLLGLQSRLHGCPLQVRATLP